MQILEHHDNRAGARGGSKCFGGSIPHSLTQRFRRQVIEQWPAFGRHRQVAEAEHVRRDVARPIAEEVVEEVFEEARQPDAARTWRRVDHVFDQVLEQPMAHLSAVRLTSRLPPTHRSCNS